MTSNRTEVLLGSEKYYHWEYNMRMTLARKGHVEIVKPENEITKAWLVNDAKALGTIAQGVELNIRPRFGLKLVPCMRGMCYETSTTIQLCHNCVTMLRRLTSSRWRTGTSMIKHLYDIDELVIELQTLREPVDEARNLVVISSSLSSKYEMIVSIVGNVRGVYLMEVKDKLLKEQERLKSKDSIMEKAS